jgi:hypothetical protein
LSSSTSVAPSASARRIPRLLPLENPQIARAHDQLDPASSRSSRATESSREPLSITITRSIARRENLSERVQASVAPDTVVDDDRDQHHSRC